MNVSRELLQKNPDLDAMRGALTRRVFDMLAKLASGEAEDYQNFWQQFGNVLKEGVVEDPQNKDRLMKLLRFATTHTGTEKQDQSLEDYVSRAQDKQDKIYYLLADNFETASASPHIEQLKEQGIEVLLLADRIDPWMVDHLTEFDGKAFQGGGRGALNLPEADGEITQDAMNDEYKPLLKKVRQVLKERVESVNVSRRLVESPACVVTSEQDLAPQLKRMLEASGQELPDAKPILEINVEHPLLTRLAAESDDHRFGELSNIILDHALLAEGTQLANPAEYVRRMNHFLLDIGDEDGQAAAGSEATP